MLRECSIAISCLLGPVMTVAAAEPRVAAPPSAAAKPPTVAPAPNPRIAAPSAVPVSQARDVQLLVNGSRLPLAPAYVDRNGRVVVQECLGSVVAPMGTEAVAIGTKRSSMPKFMPELLGKVVQRTFLPCEIGVYDMHGKSLSPDRLPALLPQWTPAAVFYERDFYEHGPMTHPLPSEICLHVSLLFLKPDAVILILPWPQVGDDGTTIVESAKTPPAPPRYLNAKSGESGMVELMLQVSKPVWLTKTLTFRGTVVEGSESKDLEVTRSCTIGFPVSQQMALKCAGSDLRTTDVHGNQTSPKAAAEALATGVWALVAEDDKPMHPFYLKMVRDDALVLKLPGAIAEVRAEWQTRPTPLPNAPVERPTPSSDKPVPAGDRAASRHTGSAAAFR